ncbi:MAG: HNH endonuclease family protein, partial [Clostridia bacterium]|nr:HNH endonuclease family protein [Clostridia bacterium]
YYLRARNRETVSDTGAVNVTMPGLRRYFTDSKNKALINDPLTMCADMLKLARIWLKVSSYPQLRVLLRFNENMKLFLASYFFRLDEENITEESLKPVLDCFLRLFALLELGDVGYSSKQFKMFLFAEQIKLIDATVSSDDIKTDFDAHISGNWKEQAKVKDALNDYDENVLVYLNELLFAREKGVAFSLDTKCDIEHIMPHSGSNRQEIRRDADIADDDEFGSVVNKLGNKILLEEKINRSIGNEWFRTKVSTTLDNKTGYIDSKYPIACALVAKYRDTVKPYWKKDDINAATTKAADRILKFIFGE